MAAAEGREDKLAGVGLAHGNLQASAALIDLANGVDVAEVQPRGDPVGVEVQGHRHDVEVAGPLPVTEERSLDAVGARHQAQLRGGDAGASVIVRVQGDDRERAPGQVRAHPLDLVGVHVGRRVLDGHRQVQDDLVVRGGAPCVGHALADLQGEIQLRGHEAFRGVLQAQVHALGDQRPARFLHERDGVGRDFDDLGLFQAEDVFTLQGGGRVVEMEDDVLGAAHRLEGAGDQVLAALAQDLDRDVVRNAILVNEAPGEVELDLRGRREADLDLLEANFDEHLEVLELLFDAHRLGEGLVAIPQIDAAPGRCAIDALGGPFAVW